MPSILFGILKGFWFSLSPKWTDVESTPSYVVVKDYGAAYKVRYGVAVAASNVHTGEREYVFRPYILYSKRVMKDTEEGEVIEDRESLFYHGIRYVRYIDM